MVLRERWVGRMKGKQESNAMAPKQKTVAAVAPGERSSSDTPMYKIATGIYRGHLPKDATPEMRAAQEIEAREAVERFDALARNLERSIASEISAGHAEAAKDG